MKRVKRFLKSARWLKEQAADPKALAEIPIVKLQRFAIEARGLNAARMKEAQPDKRYAFAVALIHRQRARALDDAADMLIRLVQRMQNTAKEKLLLLQAAHVKDSGDLAATLRDVSLAYLGEGSEAQRLQAIGLLLGPDVQQLVQRCEEHVGVRAGNHFRLLPQCFGHPGRRSWLYWRICRSAPHPRIAASSMRSPSYLPIKTTARQNFPLPVTTTGDRATSVSSPTHGGRS